MSLNPAQRTTVLAAVQANPTAQALRAAGNSTGLMNWLNAPSSPVVTVWRTEVPTINLADTINWTLYTPNDSPDNTATYTNRALLCQTKQMNLQIMMQGRTTMDFSKASVRAGMRDAVIQVPSGAGGTMTAPGGASGATLLNAATRIATEAEGILAAAAVTTGSVTANILTFEGQCSQADSDWLCSN